MITLQKIRIYPIVFCTLLYIPALAQTHKITGKVTDAGTHEPLAFVNVIYGNKNLGTSTNIDGYFSFQTSKEKINMVFSYVGYSTKIITLNTAEQKDLLKVELKSTTLNLSEVIVIAGENPAHRIINAVVKNRELNNPEKLSSFSYISYNKMYFTVDLKMRNASFDTIKVTPKTLSKFKKYKTIEANDTLITDSANSKRVEVFFAKQHLFLTETVSKRKFMYPDKNQEIVIASRSSGLKQPYFILLATQLQSFSFYTDLVEVGSKKYLSPVSKTAVKKYFYHIEDTIFTETNDTVFVISFRPSKGTLFDGLKGVLQINSNRYALQSVIAEPYKNTGGFDVKIQQKYDFIQNTQWFPVQLNTDLKFSGLQVSDHPDTLLVNDSMAVIRNRVLPLLGVGKSYIDSIEIYPYLTPKQFNNIQLEIAKNAAKHDSVFWTKYRPETLSNKDAETYRVIDSLGQAEHLDSKLQVIEKLTKGYISWNFINIDFTKILAYNHYEGLRLCMDIMTNEKILSWLFAGGYVAYGINDKNFKYGYRLKLSPDEQSETQFVSSYSYDVNEVGTYSMLDYHSLTSTEIYRRILVNRMDKFDEYKATFTFRWLRYLKTESFGRIADFTTSPDYLYNKLPDSLNYQFITSEIGVKLKYSYKEKFMKTFLGKYSFGSKYPILFFNVTHGFKSTQGNFDYWKYEAKLNAGFDLKLAGKTSLQLSGGYTDKSLPLTLLYSGYSNYAKFSIDAANTFATMRMNEFYSDKFISLFFTHDFGKLLFKAGKFRPGISICQNIGFGTLSHPENHQGYLFNTMEKGYYETGIVFSNLIHQSIVGYGIAIYYRYGPYGFVKWCDNFAVKLSFKFN